MTVNRHFDWPPSIELAAKGEMITKSGISDCAIFFKYLPRTRPGFRPRESPVGYAGLNHGAFQNRSRASPAVSVKFWSDAQDRWGESDSLCTVPL